MKLYLAICLDHHQDAYVRAFSTPELAIACAKEFVAAQDCPEEYIEEKDIEGWLYCCTYGEDDSAYVEETTLDNAGEEA